ncbi:hypothetical protein RUM43_008758 [Polyplax serrata]|uniref:CCAAT-binding factor domain-containing protein n=1 Tax=Polyplax serrata TaxID=468196 RepID=A0AAN8S871_POLSC
MKGKQQGGMKSHKKIDVHKNDSMNTKTYFKYDSDEDGGGDDDDIVEDKSKIYKKFQSKGFGKWYQEFKFVANSDESDRLPPGEIQNLKKQAGFVYNDAVIHNKSKAPKSLANSDYTWVKTVLSKGTKTDKIAAYTLLIQDAPIYNINLLKNIVEMVKVGKKKECFMAVDTLCELFLNDLLPPDRKLLYFPDQPLSKLGELAGNASDKNRRLLLWYFEDQLKSVYSDFVNLLTKIAYDSVEANRQKVITAMYKLLEGNSEMESVLLNSIVNKLGDPSRKVGSKTIYVLMKLLQTHPNMKEVVAAAVEKVIFRNNISKRAQYYSICFLSQFSLFSGDNAIAKQLLSIYLSLFKACVKTGDIDSRMMSALLAGVNKTFPYIGDDSRMIQEHINTLYKIIHLSHANIATQALSLAHLISNHSNSSVDRFYSVLYKKIGEVEMFQATNHAMLINLIYKSMKKDKEKNRVYAFIKRLLQVCAYIPVSVACGVLIMISSILKQTGVDLIQEWIPKETTTIKLEEDDSDEDGEHYKDAPEDKVETQSEEVKIKNEEEIVQVDEKKSSIRLLNVKTEEEKKVWSNPDKFGVKPNEIRDYNAFVRNPLYAGAQNCLCFELYELVHHFHPTVALFAQKIIDGEVIKYSGDPFLDFTLIRFLDKFSFKNPKVLKPDDERRLTFTMFNRKKYYESTPIRRLRANTAEYLKLNEKSIPVDELFLYKYMKKKTESRPISKGEDNDDLESVGSDEFDDLMNGIIDGKKDEIDFRTELGQLPMKEFKTKKKGVDADEDDDDGDLGGGSDGSDDDDDDNDDDDDGGGSDDGSFAEDFEGDEIDDLSDDNDLLGDDDDDEAELEASGFKLPDLPCLKKRNKSNKRKFGDAFKDSVFASAEEFAELLEEPDYNDGGSHALSNKDRAGVKQLKWESDRDKSINKKNFRSKGMKKPKSRLQKNSQKASKAGKAALKAAAGAGPRLQAPQKNIFRTEIEAQSAAAGPPLGPLLGKYGINIGNFCKDFNEKTKHIKEGVPLPVTVRVKPDRTYKLEIHTPPVEYYLMQAAGIDRAKCEGDTTAAGKLTIKHVYEIAKIKHEDPFEKYQLFELDQVVKRVKLIADNMGIEVTRDLDAAEYEEFLKARFAYLEELDRKLEEERLAKLQRT